MLSISITKMSDVFYFISDFLTLHTFGMQQCLLSSVICEKSEHFQQHVDLITRVWLLDDSRSGYFQWQCQTRCRWHCSMLMMIWEFQNFPFKDQRWTLWSEIILNLNDNETSARSREKRQQQCKFDFLSLNFSSISTSNWVFESVEESTRPCKFRCFRLVESKSD